MVQLLVRSLVQQKVKHIFGSPGGKIIPTFDVLNDEGPHFIVCWHEQNAVVVAAAIGRFEDVRLARSRLTSQDLRPCFGLRRNVRGALFIRLDFGR
jgi:hypothetical protein